MKKTLALALGVITLGVLTGCEPTQSDTTSDFSMPYDLRDCRVVTLTRGGMSSDKIFLIKCPDGYLGTSESHAVGKTRAQSTSIIVQG